MLWLLVLCFTLNHSDHKRQRGLLRNWQYTRSPRENRINLKYAPFSSITWPEKALLRETGREESGDSSNARWASWAAFWEELQKLCCIGLNTWGLRAAEEDWTSQGCLQMLETSWGSSHALQLSLSHLQLTWQGFHCYMLTMEANVFHLVLGA